jgi:hypothetical protein
VRSADAYVTSGLLQRSGCSTSTSTRTVCQHSWLGKFVHALVLLRHATSRAHLQHPWVLAAAFEQLQAPQLQDSAQGVYPLDIVVRVVCVVVLSQDVGGSASPAAHGDDSQGIQPSCGVQCSRAQPAQSAACRELGAHCGA